MRSTVAGVTELSVNLTANNETGGDLNFGSVYSSEIGRERLVVAGSDARVMVNNMEITRATNEITDVLDGLSFTLKKVDAATDINITVERDNDAVKENIQTFVTAYNDLVTYIDEQSVYNKDTGDAGPLNGDQTSRTIVSRIRDTVQRGVMNTDTAFTHLSQAGIETTRLQAEFSSVSQELDQRLLSVDKAEQIEDTIDKMVADTEEVKQGHQHILSKGGDFANNMKLVTSALPSGAYFTFAEIGTTQIAVEGKADSPFTVVSYVMALEALEKFSEVRITQIDESNIDGDETTEVESSEVSFGVIITR